MIPKIRYYRKKPYFLYKVVDKRPDFNTIKKEVRGARILYIPLYNTRTKQTAYAIYLTKGVSYW